MKFISAPFLRFVIAGGVNTALSYLVYLGALKVAPYPAAYTISFAAGIVTAYLMQSFFVFRVAISWRKALQYPLVYIAQYGLGLGLLFAQIHWLGIDQRLAPLLNVVVLIPLTFALNRWLLTRTHANAQKFNS